MKNAVQAVLYGPGCGMPYRLRSPFLFNNMKFRKLSVRHLFMVQ